MNVQSARNVVCTFIVSSGWPTTVPIAPAMPPAKRRLFCVDNVQSELADARDDMEMRVLMTKLDLLAAVLLV